MFAETQSGEKKEGSEIVSPNKTACVEARLVLDVSRCQSASETRPAQVPCAKCGDCLDGA